MLPLPNRYYRYVADYAIGYHNPDLLYDVYDYQIVREQPNAGPWKIYVFYDSDEDKNVFSCIGDANFYVTEAPTEVAAIRLLDAITSAEKNMVSIIGVWERQKLLAKDNPTKLAAAWKYIGRQALSPYLDLVESYLDQLPEAARSNYLRFAIPCNYYEALRSLEGFWLNYEAQIDKKPQRRTGVMVFQPKTHS